LPLSLIQPQLDEMESKRWAQIENNHLRLTALGQQYLNDVVGLFL
jgi:coproporphyrinogen III oxidase-like Fe-S oxidoreductase